MGKFRRALRTVFFFRRKPSINSTGPSKTPKARLIRILPLVFRELSGALFRFSRVAVWAVRLLLPVLEDIMIFHPHTTFWPPVLTKPSHFLPSKRKLIGRSRKSKLYRRSLLFLIALAKKKTPGSILRSLPVFLAAPPSKTRTLTRQPKHDTAQKNHAKKKKSPLPTTTKTQETKHPHYYGGPIVNRTYGTLKSLPGIYLPVFTITGDHS